MYKQARLIPAGLYYFFFYGGMAAVFPYLAIYYASQGLDATQIGILGSLYTLVGLFGSPFWNGIADATHRHHLILRSCMIGAMAGIFMLSVTHTFLGFIPMVILYGFTLTPTISVVDASVLTLLKEDSDRYGSIRVWGSVGWAVIALVAGNLIENLNLKWMFYIFLALMSLALLVTFRIPITHQTQHDGFKKEFSRLVRDRKWWIFLGAMILTGLAFNVINNFLSLYLDNLGYSGTFIGVMVTLSSLSEIPIMFLGYRFLTRLRPRRLLMIAVCLYALRLVMYAFAIGPVLIIIAQLMNGVTYGFLMLAGVAYAASIAPTGLEATAQGLFSAAYINLSGVLGGVFGGMLYQSAGPASMFLWIAGTTILGVLLLFSLPEVPTNH